MPQENIAALTASAGFFPPHGITNIYVDGSRTDQYVQQGTKSYPYKTIQSAINNARSYTSMGMSILI